jgi:hypothetical protein
MSRRGIVLVLLLLDAFLVGLLAVPGVQLWRELAGFALIILAVVPVVLVAFTLAVRRYFPRELRLAPAADDEVAGDVAALDERYRALGFARTGPAAKLNTRPPLLVLGYAHPEGRQYACITRTRLLGVPSVTHGFVSLLEDGSGTFETMCLSTGDTELPAPPGVVRQVCRNLEPPDVLALHRSGLQRLEARGGRLREARAQEFAPEFVRAMERLGAEIRALPFHRILFGLVLGGASGYSSRQSSVDSRQEDAAS